MLTLRSLSRLNSIVNAEACSWQLLVHSYTEPCARKGLPCSTHKRGDVTVNIAIKLELCA